MKAIIEKTDSEGQKSTFTIIGYDYDDIYNMVNELTEHSDSLSLSERYSILEFL